MTQGLFPIRMNPFFGLGPDITLSREATQKLFTVMLVANAIFLALAVIFRFVKNSTVFSLFSYTLLTSSVMSSFVVCGLLFFLTKPLWHSFWSRIAHLWAHSVFQLWAPWPRM
jgi:hypothetical protein